MTANYLLVRTRTLALALAAVVALPLAGGATAAPAPKGPKALRDYPVPAVSGKQVVDGVEAFSSAFRYRHTATPPQRAASEAVAAEARSLGYEVEMRTYAGVLQAVVATKKGTDKAGELLMFGGHLDNVPTTVDGAYDNGSGTRMIMGLAQSFAKVRTHRTLQFVWYNGEENGVLTSEQMAQEYKAAGTKVKAFLGFDMVGIAWPVGVPLNREYCLCMWRGARDEGFDALLADVNYRFLKFPKDEEMVSIEGRNVRNSDESSWADAGFPTLRWAGMRRAASYPEYHKLNDTVATMERVAGGRQFLEKGMRNTLLSAYYTAAALDLQK